MSLFKLDKNLVNNSEIITELKLSTVLLKKDKSYPWLILVPRKQGISEIYQLEQEVQYQLISEINQTSIILRDYFKPDKINIGSLGNIVSQLHIHVVARFKNDQAWPHSVWQDGLSTIPYNSDEITNITTDLASKFNEVTD